MSSSAIVKETGLKKSKVISILNHLVEQDYIEKTGNGRGTKYQR
jgi:DNA-binding IclR family transcriptional regulator